MLQILFGPRGIDLMRKTLAHIYATWIKVTLQVNLSNKIALRKSNVSHDSRFSPIYFLQSNNKHHNVNLATLCWNWEIKRRILKWIITIIPYNLIPVRDDNSQYYLTLTERIELFLIRFFSNSYFEHYISACLLKHKRKYSINIWEET